jgi:hypothetical protein
MDYKEKIDYSSLSTYMSCPRKFLFQYMMHLCPAGTSIHLVFGSCWHYGLEESYNLLKESKSPGSSKDVLKPMDLTINSIKAFNKLWALDGAPLWKDEDLIFPKSPGHAANMYKAYWERFMELDSAKRNVLAVEAPFAIDLSLYGSNLPRYIGRIDLVLTDGEGIEILDHKTAKAIYKITPQQFEMSFQTDGYLTAGRLFYDKIPKITYRVALCQKSKIDFQPITISKRSSAIDHFLHDLIYYVEKLQEDIRLLEEDKVNCTNRTDLLQSFRRNCGSACTSFMSPCTYFDLCRLRNNPLDWFKKAPQGFHYQEWDPDDHDSNMRKRLAEVKS